MALLTTNHKKQMQSLRDAANGGLAKHVADFIIRSLEFMSLQEEHPGGLILRSRKEIQEHLDTLTELVDNWVHRENRGGNRRSKK